MVIALLCVLGLVEFVRGALVLSLLPFYGKLVNGFGIGVIGTAISLQYLLDNCFRIPAGWLNDRYGGKKLIISGIFLSILGVCFLYFARNTALFWLGAGLYGLGIAPVWPVVIAGSSVRSSLSRISEVLSRVYIAWLVGGGLGPITANFIIGRSYQLTFDVLIGVMLISLLCVVFGDIPSAGPNKQNPLLFLKETYRELFSFRIIYPGMLLQNMSFGILIAIIVVYAQEVFGLTAGQFNFLLISGGIFTVVLLVPAGKLVDRFGFKLPLLMGFFVSAASLAILPLQKSINHALLTGMFLGIAYSFILPAWNGMLARVVSEEKRGTMWAFFMTVEGIGIAAGAYLGGMIWEMFGQTVPFYVSSLALAGIAVVYTFINFNKLVKTSQK